jgi:fructose 1,6-bisphosphate aldolase/phosphatase
MTPSKRMLEVAEHAVKQAVKEGLLIDGYVCHSGDDIGLLMSHTHGEGAEEVHQFAWDVFIKATDVAKKEGLYGAGQDLLADAPSANIRGAGPGVAEIELEYGTEKRPVESMLLFFADKCGPGAYNLPLFLAFADPMFSAGLMLPDMIKGFDFTLIDMDYKGADSIITLSAPDEYYYLTLLLRDSLRYGIDAIHSRTFGDKVAAVSAMRLHTIAGKYVGKDDPVALVRTQRIFPAPEEVVSPYMMAHYVEGDARGSHVMPFMPVPINTPVTGPYCLPIVSCLAFSLAPDGSFSAFIDVFDNPAWDYVRILAQKKALEIRKQGWSGPAMLPTQELEYGGFRDVIKDLEARFRLRIDSDD